ncbi:MAG TPA: hypothetical protein DEP99_04650 [Nitrospiraceae bacterium]|nr:hypothetical protein [Nitrospiraceae bacterium]
MFNDPKVLEHTKGRSPKKVIIVKGKLVNIVLSLLICLLLSSCGYHLVGSGQLPFNSATIEGVDNRTYEPRLEERLHKALSEEFLAQGIRVMSTKGGDLELKPTVTYFAMTPIAEVGGRVQEYAIVMKVNVRLKVREEIIELKDVESPLRITFKAESSVRDVVMEKEKATDRACREIAREIINKLLIRYAK